ncbi:hypothetical protein JCM18901_3098 [Psychrobacter sp. JCM 18901]|nr:hypothetical protein JCM18901_3098 [Psychrobacter sp. JCM 18901]
MFTLSAPEPLTFQPAFAAVLAEAMASLILFSPVPPTLLMVKSLFSYLALPPNTLVASYRQLLGSVRH